MIISINDYMFNVNNTCCYQTIMVAIIIITFAGVIALSIALDKRFTPVTSEKSNADTIFAWATCCVFVWALSLVLLIDLKILQP